MIRLRDEPTGNMKGAALIESEVPSQLTRFTPAAAVDGYAIDMMSTRSFDTRAVSKKGAVMNRYRKDIVFAQPVSTPREEDVMGTRSVQC